jgi:hypothetical protein
LHETTLPTAGADDGALELLDGDGGLSFPAHTRVVARRHRRLALSTPMAMDGMIGLGWVDIATYELRVMYIGSKFG